MIELKNISAAYDDGQRILDGIDFSMKQGEFVYWSDKPVPVKAR